VLPLNSNGKASWSFDERFAGRKVRDVKKFVSALMQLVPSGLLQVYDLEQEREVFRVRPSMSAEDLKQQRFRELLNDLVAVETQFNVAFLMPETFSDGDLEALAVLKAYAEGRSLSLKEMNVVLTKSVENQHTVPNVLGNPGRLRFQNENPQARLLGAVVNVGPAELSTDNATVNDLKETVARFNKTEIGDGASISFKPNSPVRFSLVQ
jgi:hypothetical protein